MNHKKAKRLSEALVTIRDGYKAKAEGVRYSEMKLSSAFQYIEDVCQYIDRRADDEERDFLFSCFGALDELREQEDALKISRFADAIHRVPYLFCDVEKWDKAFKNKYLLPFCRMYGDEWFSDLLSVRIRQTTSKPKKTIYRYNEDNIMSLPGYFCFRMFFPLLTLPFIIGMLIYFHCSYSDYTQDNHGQRYEITVTNVEYENEGIFDYLYISCEEFEEEFEVSRFFQYSNSPEELVRRCEAGEKLVAYALYREPEERDAYYRVIQLESLDGTVYRSYEHTNQGNHYLMAFPFIVCGIIFVPFFVLFLMMLIVALNRERFVPYPRFVKFCFPDYSLALRGYYKA